MFHLAHSRVMLGTKNDHLHISFSLEIDRCLDVLIQMEDEEYESVKRPHVTTGIILLTNQMTSVVEPYQNGVIGKDSAFQGVQLTL